MESVIELFIFQETLQVCVSVALTSSWMSSSAAGLVSSLRLGRTCSQKYVIKRVEWTFFCQRRNRISQSVVKRILKLSYLSELPPLRGSQCVALRGHNKYLSSI